MQSRRQGLYIISVAAQILDMHPQTLRKYERAGFIEPPRLGTLRLYSDEDIARLRLIKHLVDELGLNLAGVELALRHINRLVALRRRVENEKDPEKLRDAAGAAIDRLLGELGLTVTNDTRRTEDRPSEMSPYRRAR